MRVFILLLLPFLAYSFILRLPCVHYADFIQQHNTVTQTITGLTLQTLSDTDLNTCMNNCIFHPNCTGANYSASLKVCHLLDSKQSQIYVFGVITLTTEAKTTHSLKIGAICEDGNGPCRNGQYCRDVCDASNQHTYRCLDSSNVAPNGTITQSTGVDIQNAIDNDINTNSQASATGGAFWMIIDLADIFYVWHIELAAPGDRDTHKGYKTGLSVDGASYKYCMGEVTLDAHTLIFTCGYEGRYVGMSTSTMTNGFHPSEIRVFV